MNWMTFLLDPLIYVCNKREGSCEQNERKVAGWIKGLDMSPEHVLRSGCLCEHGLGLRLLHERLRLWVD